MEISGYRRFASEKTLFYLTALVLLLMPASEILAEILTRYFEGFHPSFFYPLVFGTFGVLGTIVAVIWKSLELTAPKTRGQWYASDVFYLLMMLFMTSPIDIFYIP